MMENKLNVFYKNQLVGTISMTSNKNVPFNMIRHGLKKAFLSVLFLCR